MTINPVLADITEAIRLRSAPQRRAYLERIRAYSVKGPRREHLSCSNLAHVSAGAPQDDKQALNEQNKPNLAIITAYNDMLSAHQPFERYPRIIRKAARDAGGTAQVASGVPAMCDGVTQGQDGMDLSLFSRDVIAMATAIGLSHDAFDGVLYLGVCDKIVPGLLIGALAFGHLPAIFVPAGPMPSGIGNEEKAKARRDYAQGKISRAQLLQSEARAYHAPGTCTFYGTANTNQMMMEIMGLHLPGASFVPPDTPLRDALTRHATQRALAITALGNAYTPIGELADERSFVNAMIGVLATGGSTNHTLHIVAAARAAGITLTWDDFSRLSEVIPLLARVYPNGMADVNHFHAAGGMRFIIGALLDAGLLHNDVVTVWGTPMEGYLRAPKLHGDTVVWEDAPGISHDTRVLRTAAEPFQTSGGLRVLDGNLGRAVIKISAVDTAHHVIEAPARVFHSQAALQEAFQAGDLEGDMVVVMRFQGPKAVGMPELHGLTPPLSILQGRGASVALITDGRMSGASGKIPAAIHLTPEALDGGPIARIRDGDPIRLDAPAGTLDVLIDARTWQSRQSATADLGAAHRGLGRELFAGLRSLATAAERGGGIF